jgi:branched-chain amino acid transport system substrate-binding protein
MLLKRIGTMGCIALSVVGLAACGSSSKSSSSSSTTAASTPASTSAATSTAATTSTAASTSATAATGAPLVVGAICSCSGAVSASLSGNDRVLAAWASSVNAAGGINGHPVKVINKDDAGTPATALQAAKDLVTNDHVMGIIDMSVADAAFAPYVSAKGIPVVGGDGTLSTFIANPNFYPSNTQLPATTVGMAQIAKQDGATHFGIAYCAEAPVCAQLDPLGKAAATAAGLKYSSTKVAATAPNYAAPCLQLKSNGVDAFYVADTPEVTVRVFDSCTQQGFKPKFVGNMGGLSNIVLSDKNLDGGLTVGGSANPYDPSTPGIAQFYAALQKYAPGIVGTTQLKYTMIMAWSGGKLFEAAAKAGNLTPTSTPAQLKQALYKLHNETLGGIAPPLTFTPGKPTFIPCFFSMKITGGKFVSQNTNKPVCLTATQSKAAGG